MAGYNKLRRRITPEKMLRRCTPFPQMQGKIVFADHPGTSAAGTGFSLCGIYWNDRSKDFWAAKTLWPGADNTVLLYRKVRFSSRFYTPYPA